MQNHELSILEDHDYTVEVVNWIKHGWQIFKQESKSFIGFSALVLCIDLILLFISNIGPSVSFVLDPILYAGFYVYSFKIMRSQSRSFRNFFDGFKQTGNLIMSSLISIAISSIPIFLFLIITLLVTALIGVFAALGFSAEKRSITLGTGDVSLLKTLFQATVIIAILLSVALFAVSLVISIYWSVNYSMSMALIVDRHMKFWPSLEVSRKVLRKKWRSIFNFLLALGLLNLLGLLALGVGLLVTFPWSMCAMAYGYSQIFGLAPKVSMSDSFE